MNAAILRLKSIPSRPEHKSLDIPAFFKGIRSKFQSIFFHRPQLRSGAKTGSMERLRNPKIDFRQAFGRQGHQGLGSLKAGVNGMKQSDSNVMVHAAAPRVEPNPPRVVVTVPLACSFYARSGKRLLDIVIASAAFVLLSPVMVVTALIVAFGDGLPVIYSQPRAGVNLRPFTIAKFRTMFQNCEERQGSWKRSDPQWQEHAGSVPQRDPRIIPGGNALRRYSLDELPQLWNVLRGDMSIVGPRPLLCSQVESNRASLGDVLARRALVRPGITGLWQVSGRSDVTFAKMMVLDTEYVETLSFRTDLSILLRTVKVVLRGSGAA